MIRAQRSLVNLFLLLACFVPCQLRAQGWRGELAEYLRGRSAVFPVSFRDEGLSYTQLAGAVSPYLRDSSAVVRQRAYGLLFARSQQGDDARARRAFTGMALAQLPREEAAGVEVLLSHLRRFRLADFDERARSSLEQLLFRPLPHRDQLFLLGGFVLRSEEPFRFLLTRGNLGEQERTAARLALVRLGNTGRLDNLLENAREMPSGDRFGYEVAPLLAYVRQKKAMDLLLERILRDENACTPADAETAGRIPCAYRLLELVAPLIRDFPVMPDESGDLDTGDYPAALAKARDWIRQYRDNYRLVREVY